MGQRASNTATITFNDIEVPAENLLGEENKGFKLAMMTLDRTRPGVAAMAVGIARAAFEFATEYSKERVQFGVPIAMHQAIQFMIADMATEIEAARLLTLAVGASLLDQGKRNTLESSHAKRFAADTAMEVTTDAVQVYGGYGFIKEYPVEKLMRDAKIMQLYEGTSQIQRLVIARETLLPRRIEEPRRRTRRRSRPRRRSQPRLDWDAGPPVGRPLSFAPMRDPGHVALGAWSGGRFLHFGQEIDEERLGRAADGPARGIDTVLTADVYGAGEADRGRWAGRSRGRRRATTSAWSARSGTTSIEGERDGPRGFPRFTDPSAARARGLRATTSARGDRRRRCERVRRRRLRPAAAAQPRPHGLHARGRVGGDGGGARRRA